MPQSKLGVVQDRHQDVVELVRRGAGQLTNGGQTFALHEPLLEIGNPAILVGPDGFKAFRFFIRFHRISIGFQPASMQQDCPRARNCARKDSTFSPNELVFIKLQSSFAMNTLEALETMLAIAHEEGIQVRSEWLSGVRGGLVRVGSKAVLFVDQALSVSDQLEQVRSALGALDWSETSHAQQMAVCLSKVPRGDL